MYRGHLALRSGRQCSADAVHGEADIEADGAAIFALQESLKLKSKGSARLTLADADTEIIDVHAERDVHLGVVKGLAAGFDLKAESICDVMGVLQDMESRVHHDRSVLPVQVRATCSATLRDEQWAR